MPSAHPSQADKPVVLVTGSSGLIGACLCESLVPKYHVIGLDIQDFDPSVPGAQWIETDLTSDDSVQKRSAPWQVLLDAVSRA